MFTDVETVCRSDGELKGIQFYEVCVDFLGLVLESKSRKLEYLQDVSIFSLITSVKTFCLNKRNKSELRLWMTDEHFGTFFRIVTLTLTSNIENLIKNWKH